jgi:hypothetical protein
MKLGVMELNQSNSSMVMILLNYMNYPTLRCEDGVSSSPSAGVCFERFFEPSCLIDPQ